MKIRPIHVALLVIAMLMLTMWLTARHKEASVANTGAEPESAALAAQSQQPSAIETPVDPLTETPEARAYRSRLAFEQSARAFLRDAPKLDNAARLARARALSREIDRREQVGELSASEAMTMQIGLIHAAVTDNSERLRQSRAVTERYRERTAIRQAAFAAQQQRDAQFQQYKVREAQIVSEVLAMTEYPNGMSRDDYLRLRLQEARAAISNATTPPPTTAPPIPVVTPTP
jgi:hypothetical protein